MKKWKLVLLAMVLAFTMTACGQNADVSVDEAMNDTVQSETTGDNSEAETTDVEVVESLKEVYEAYGMKAGTCLSDYMIKSEYCSNLIKENFNSVTLENHMKPDYILDQKASQAAGDIVVSFNKTTKELLQWCKDNGMAMRGHTLVWYSQTPDWIFYENFQKGGNLASREVMLARMESYIRQVFEQLESLGYIEMFYAYDVVNEAWEDNSKMRECLWKKTIGDDYLWYAFYYADKYAPEYIDLYYNDYNEQFKTTCLYEFVQTLVDENGRSLIDGVGFQAHLYTEDSLYSYFKCVDKLATTGLKINLTELDVSLGTWQNIKPATQENLKAQGQFYYELINGLFTRVEEGTLKMDALTFWGFSDQLSWRKDRSPLLYDGSYAPKYAYYGALQIKEKAGFDEE